VLRRLHRDRDRDHDLPHCRPIEECEGRYLDGVIHRGSEDSADAEEQVRWRDSGQSGLKEMRWEDAERRPSLK
jgi:hypothetical protein